VLLGRNPFISHFGSESANDLAMVADIIERLELGDLARRDVDTLSGGERQRIVIARALAQEAPVLLLDEPTSALDLGHQLLALELVDRLRREHGLTVVSAMHDLTLAGIFSDRLVLLHEGSAVATGTAEEVLRPETLGEFYGVNVRILREPDGTIVVVPSRDARPS
jgi:iron complex transport system ATP-binding protein